MILILKEIKLSINSRVYMTVLNLCIIYKYEEANRYLHMTKNVRTQLFNFQWFVFTLKLLVSYFGHIYSLYFMINFFCHLNIIVLDKFLI